MDGLWERAADRMRDQLGQVGFETWIGPLTFVGVDAGTATIEAPNRFFKDWVNERYLTLLRQSLSAEVGEPVDVRLTLGQNGAMVIKSATGNGHVHGNGNGKPTASTMNPRTEMQARDRHPQLNPRYTFTEFVVGSGNQFAHAAALAVANQPGEKYNPLFIYGGVGLGKTHLVNAIGHQIWQSDRNKKVLFMSAEVFMNELINSIRRDKTTEFRDKFRRVDALILDDVQFLAGRDRTQEEFFHTFNSLHSERHQIVLTSDKVPKDIPGLEDRLRNRFESGLIADIAPPDLETRIAIIQKKAAIERLRLPSDVFLYIAQNVSTNVRELEGCLTRLAALASLNNCEITLGVRAQGAARFDSPSGTETRCGIDPAHGVGFVSCSPRRFEIEEAHPAHRVLPPGRDVSMPQAHRLIVSLHRRGVRPRSFHRHPCVQPDCPPNEQ